MGGGREGVLGANNVLHLDSELVISCGALRETHASAQL